MTASPSRVATRYATLSQSEKEDRESERLVRKSPKKKPPRKDLRRRRVQDQEDDPDKKQDRKDRSNNYKDASGDLHDALVEVGERPARVAGQSTKKFLEEEGDKIVRSPETGKDVKVRSLASTPPNSKSRKLYDKMRAQWAEKKDKEEKEKGEDKKDPAPEADIAKGLASDDPKERTGASTEILDNISEYVDLKGLDLSEENDLYDKFSDTLTDILDGRYDALMEKAKAKAGQGATPEELSEAFMGEAMDEFSRKADTIVSQEIYVRKKKEEEEALDSWTSALRGTLYDDGVARDVENLDDVADKSSFKEEYEARLSNLAGQEDTPGFRKQVEKSRKIVDGFDENKLPKDPKDRKKALKEYAEAVARVQHFEEVINDPLSVFKGDVTDRKAVKAALEKYKKSDDDLIEKHTKKIDDRIAMLSEPPEDGEDDAQKAAREKELKKAQTIRKVLAAKKIISEGLDGKGVPKAVSRLYIAAEKTGRLEDLITMDDSGGDAASQGLLRDVYSRLPLEDLVKLLDEDHPGRKILENVNDPDSLASQDDRGDFRKFVEDMLVAEVAFADEEDGSDEGSDDGEGRRRRREPPDDPSSTNFFDKLMEALEKAKSNFSEILGKTKEFTSQYIRGLARRRRTAHLIRMSREWDFAPWEE